MCHKEEDMSPKSKFSDITTAIIEGRTELWLHDNQKKGVSVLGSVIYPYLEKTGLLAGCADLAELEAIRAKGLDFFRKYFAEKNVSGWRGIKDRLVPCIIEGEYDVLLFYFHINCLWTSNSPALRRIRRK
jgi:hypothetical protein